MSRLWILRLRCLEERRKMMSARMAMPAKAEPMPIPATAAVESPPPAVEGDGKATSPDDVGCAVITAGARTPGHVICQHCSTGITMCGRNSGKTLTSTELTCEVNSLARSQRTHIGDTPIRRSLKPLIITDTIQLLQLCRTCAIRSSSSNIDDASLLQFVLLITWKV